MHTYLTVSYFNPLREGAKGMGVVLIPLIIFFGKKTPPKHKIFIYEI